MFDLATMTATPVILKVGEIELKATPLTIDNMGEIEAWANRQLPDPVALAKQLAEGQSDEVAKTLLTEAYRDMRRGVRQIHSPDVIMAMGSLQGLREVLRIGLRKHHPEIAGNTEALDAILSKLTESETAVSQLNSLAFGKAAAEPAGPKSPGPEATDAPEM